jgi:hypothetical protein
VACSCPLPSWTPQAIRLYFKTQPYGIKQGVTMDSLKFHPGQPCSTCLLPGARSLLKQPYGLFRGSPPIGRAACGPLLPPWTPHAYEFDLLFPPRDEIALSIIHLCRQQQSMKWLWVNSGIRCIYKCTVWGVQRDINGCGRATPEMAGKLFQG